MSLDARDQTRLIAQVLNSHLQHDLTLQDREVLKKASKQFLFCALGGVVLGSAAAARFTFVGKYHPRNLRKLPSLYNRQANKLDQAVLKDRLAFFGRAFVLSSIGLIAGTQLGVSFGYYLSNRTLDREGDRDKITRAMMAAQNELKEKLGLKDSRMKQSPEEVDGENTSLASGWEREQVVNDEPKNEFVEEGSKKQRFVPPPISSDPNKRSRWQELQNGKQEPSTWERIRQENAKGSMSKERENQPASFDNGEIKGRDYEAEQKAFAELMDKERRGGTDGFVVEDLTKRRPSM